jgi:hypothetical protein
VGCDDGSPYLYPKLSDLFSQEHLELSMTGIVEITLVIKQALFTKSGTGGEVENDAHSELEFVQWQA